MENFSKLFLFSFFTVFFIFSSPYKANGCVCSADTCSSIQLLCPEDGATSFSFSDPESPAHFCWCEVNNAKSYILRITFTLSYMETSEVYVVHESPIEDNEIFILPYFNIFAGNTPYEWQVAPCFGEGATNCGDSCGTTTHYTLCADFSPKRSFTTEELELVAPELISPGSSPTSLPIVNTLDSLAWQRSWWAGSFIYEIKDKNANILVSSGATTSFPISLKRLWPSLSLNKTYSWKIKNCLYEDADNCGPFSLEWKFKTTGAAPTTLSTPDNSTIPTKLEWQDVPGAASYSYELLGGDTPVTGKTLSSEVIINYPQIRTLKTYRWKVRSCADKEGDICGVWSGEQEFTTAKLGVPSEPNPSDGGLLYTYNQSLSWKKVPGANFYQYKIDSSDGTTVIDETVASSNFILIPFSELGEYSWFVQACLDKECEKDVGDISGWTFTYDEPTPPAQFGIVPCDRDSDNPDTPWNERDACEIKHIFITAKTILDFIMWRAVPMALIVLVITTFIKSYFLMDPASIKPLWKTAGEGYLIIFLAWTTITFILKIFGISEEWWILPF